jgi:putative ABC transport system permease protein
VRARAAAAAAGWGLRAYQGTAVLLALSGAVTLVAVVPIAALVRAGGAGDLAPRLLLAPPRLPLAEPGWAMARAAGSLQAEAVAVLFQALVGTAAAAFAVGALGMLLVFAARAAERTGEMTLRRAVGASARALLAAALLEGGTVAAAAVMAGFAAGLAGGAVAARAWPGTLAAGTWLPALAAAGTAAVVILSGALLAVAFAPRRRLTEVAARPLGLTVAAAQLGLALVILTAGALLARHAASPPGPWGHAPGGGAVLMGSSAEAEPGARSARFAALLERLRSGADFDSVSLTSTGAVVGLGTVAIVTTECGVCRYGGLFVPQHWVVATHQLVSADSFQALGVRVMAGRGITDADGWGAPRVAVVSRTLALRHFQDGQAIGRRLLLGNDPRVWHTVVGVVDVPPVAGLGGALLPSYTVYASVLQHPARNVELLLRPRPTRTVGDAVLATVARAMDAGPVARMSEAALLAAQRAPVLWFGRLLAVEGWLTLSLAVMSTVVQMRLWVRSLAPELGLRRAVGASRRHIVGLVLGRAGAVGLTGVMIGLALGPAVWSALGTIVQGLPAWEPGLVLRYAALLVATTTVAALVPALGASGTAPAGLLADPGS